MINNMTPTIEEYLEALFHLRDKGKAVSTKDLAEHLKIAPASVTDMIKKLADKKLVIHTPYKGAILTKNGLKAAAALVRRHRLSERFLADMLGVPWEDLHDEACKFEHVISDQVEEKLLEALGNPKTCPHGNPIPTSDGSIVEDMSIPLTSFNPKETGTITKIKEENPEFLHYLASLGLFPKVCIEVKEIAPFSGPIIIKTRGASYALGRDVACNIFLHPDTEVKKRLKHGKTRRKGV